MADFGAPVAGPTTQPNQIGNTLASIFQIRSARAQAQQEQQTAKQRSAMADYWNTHEPPVDSSGAIDMNALASDKDFIKAAGDFYPQQLSQIAGVRQQQLQNINTLSNMDAANTNTFREAMGGLKTASDLQDPDKGKKLIDDTMDSLSKQNPEMAKIVGIYKPQLDSVGPKEWPVLLQHFQLQAMQAGNQAAAQTPEYVQQGGIQTQVKSTAPGGENLLTNTPQKLVNTLTPGENIDYQQQLVAAKAQTQTNFENITKNRNAASIAPQQLDQINKADELSKQVSTGAWAAERGKIESGLSGLIPGLATAGNDATKLQLLDKFAERISADSSKVLGDSPSTDAARDSIHRMNANIGYTPEAIQNVLHYAKAQTLAMQAKGDAQEAWLKQNGNTINNQQDFETSWRQAYDPVAFQLEAATTPEEKAKIINSLSPEQAKELREKRKQMKAIGVNIQ